MKLLTKTGIYYLITMLGLFLLGGFIFYFSLTGIINESLTDAIYTTKGQVIEYTEEHQALPPETHIGIHRITFTETPGVVEETIRDTILPDEDDEPKPYRSLVFPVRAGEKNYSARITRPLVESDEMIESIVDSLGILSALLLVVLFLLNWFLSKKLWKPFRQTLDSLRKFDLTKKEAMYFPPVGTTEFRMLNEELQKMTEKTQQDYRSLKEFTENASHELQTPLAIMRSKMELMIQSENLSEEQMKLVQGIYESANRLSKLNQSLLLLAKIENRQFHEIQPVDLKKLIENKLEQFAEMTSFKNIRVETHFHSTPEIKMNPQLADILLSNIIGNAIKHNLTGGTLSVEVKNNSLAVSNSGNAPDIDPEKLFERFQKASPSSESVGLGLSIARQICDTYGYKVNYTFSEGMHTLSILF